MHARFILLALLCLATSGLAQTRDLDQSIVSSATLDASQRQAISRFIVDWGERLETDDARRAKTALRRVLDNPEATVAFRLEVNRSIMSHLRAALEGDPTDPVTFQRMSSALIVAGSLATDDGTALLLQFTEHEDESVRYLAAMSLGQSLAMFATGNSALDQNRVSSVISRLGVRLKEDPKPHVAERLVESLAAARFSQQDAVRTLALKTIADGLVARLTRMRETEGPAHQRELTAALRGLDALHKAIITPNRTANITREAGTLSGEAFAYIRKRLDAGVDSRERDALVQLCRPAETLLYFSHSRASPSATGIQTKLAEKVRDGDDDAFDTEVQRIIGPGQRLSKPPFSIDVSRWND